MYLYLHLNIVYMMRIYIYLYVYDICIFLLHANFWSTFFSTFKLPIPALSSKQNNAFKKTTRQAHPQKPFHASCPSSTAAPPTPSNQLVVDPISGPTTRF